MNILDVHTHGIGGFDTRTTSKENILKIAGIQGSRGVTEIVLTVYPSSIVTMRGNMRAIKEAMEAQRSAAGLPGSEAKILGIHLEGPFLNPLKCGSLDAGSFLEPGGYMLGKLVDGFGDIIKIITVSPELAGAPSLIKDITGRGIIASMGHSDATYAEAETGYNSGARGITHIFNAMRGIHHREPGLAGFGLMNQDVYIEVIADPFHLAKKIIEFIFSVKDPEKIMIVSDSVKDTDLGSSPRGIINECGRLLGGSMTSHESAGRLIALGLSDITVSKALYDNPREYLRRLT
ncbi:MAG: hypothetical protein AB1499_08135 [Nitrospirota bacterium]